MKAMGQLRAQLRTTPVAESKFVRFEANGVRIVDEPGDGLAKQEAADAFREAFASELARRGNNAGARERLMWKKEAGAYADALLVNVRQARKHVSVADFVRLYDGVAGLRSPQDVADATRALRLPAHAAPRPGLAVGDAKTQSAPPLREASRSAQTEARRKQSKSAFTATVLAGVLDAYELRPSPMTAEDSQEAEALDLTGYLESLARERFAGGRLREYLERVTNGRPTEEDPDICHEMIRAVRSDPSLAPIVLEHVNGILAAQRPAVSGGQALAGPWPAIALLVLTLHPDALADIFMTPAELKRLAVEAGMAIGRIADILSPGGSRAVGVLMESGSIGECWFALRDMARDYLGTSPDSAFVTRLASAFRILSFNAEWLDQFGQWADTADPQLLLDIEGKPLREVMNRYMPRERFQPAAIGFLPCAPGGPALADVQGQAQATPPREIKEAPPAASGHDPELVVHAAATAPKPAHAKAAKAPRAKAQAGPGEAAPREALPSAPADEKAVKGARSAHRPNVKQPGAKVKNPPAHVHHNKALTKEEQRRRDRTNEAIGRGQIGRFETWTPQLAQHTRAQRRVLAGLDAPGGPTSRLVTQTDW